MTRRTVERRKEREQEKKRNRQMTILLSVGAVAILAVILIAVLNIPAEAPIPDTSTALYADLERSTTDDGFARIGNPDAPVSVIEYSSFGCAGCKAFHDAAIGGLMERVRTGAVAFTYVPMASTGSVVNAQGAARAAICAGEQGRFWEYHDALFNWQGLYGNQAFTATRLRTGAQALGLDVGAWESCATGSGSQQVIDDAENAARLQGISSTPTVVVNGVVVALDTGYEAVSEAIDRAIASGGLPPVEATPEATAEATAEATVEATAEATSEATIESAPPAEATVEATAEATAAP
jgi:protein-disulfide isomerase